MITRVRTHNSSQICEMQFTIQSLNENHSFPPLIWKPITMIPR